MAIGHSALVLYADSPPATSRIAKDHYVSRNTRLWHDVEIARLMSAARCAAAARAISPERRALTLRARSPEKTPNSANLRDAGRSSTITDPRARYAHRVT
jgi:hypothetical protein